MRYKGELTYDIKISGNCIASSKSQADRFAEELFDKGWYIVLPREAAMKITGKNTSSSLRYSLPQQPCLLLGPAMQRYSIEANGKAHISLTMEAEMESEAKEKLMRIAEIHGPVCKAPGIAGISPGIRISSRISNIILKKETERNGNAED